MTAPNSGGASLTPAQEAQQNNRGTGGRYAEKLHQEAVFEPPVDEAAVRYPDIGSWEPSGVDAEIARIHAENAPLWDKFHDLRKYDTRRYRASYPDELCDRRLAEADALLVDIRVREEPLAELEAEYERRGGWTRYFLVEHLHTSRHCSSFRPTTRIGWLPAYSGRSTDDMIAAAGDMVCTKCVPDAPVAGKRPTLPELAAEWDKKQQAADDACPGSGTYLDRAQPHRIGYYTGNWATCPGCGERRTVHKSSQKILKHKRPTV